MFQASAVRRGQSSPKKCLLPRSIATCEPDHEECKTMKIGILGTGDVGRALGKGFGLSGHEVKMGSRDSNNPKAKAWAAEVGPAASAGSFAEVAQFAELVVL